MFSRRVVLKGRGALFYRILAIVALAPIDQKERKEITMSSTNVADATSKGKPQQNAGTAAQPKWVDFDTDRELLSFNNCEEKGIKPTIEGWVIGEERIKEADPESEMPAFDCIVMLLTAPVELVNKEGEKYTAPKGTTLLVPKSVRLGAVADVASHPTEIYQMRITPTDKVKLEGVKKMRKFKCQINPTPGDRKLIAPASATKLMSRSTQSQAPALPPAPFE